MAKNSNNNSKTTKTVEPVTKTPAKNDNSKKKATATAAPSVTTKVSKNKNEGTFTLIPHATKTATVNDKTPPVTFSIDKKATGSGSNQAGKKRGSYTQNLWALEFREGGEGSNKYLADPREVYVSRDDAREALDFFRGETNYKKGDARLAKYTFNRADHS